MAQYRCGFGDFGPRDDVVRRRSTAQQHRSLPPLDTYGDDVVVLTPQALGPARLRWARLVAARWASRFMGPCLVLPAQGTGESVEAVAAEVLDIDVPLPRSQRDIDSLTADLRCGLSRLARKVSTKTGTPVQQNLLVQARSRSRQPTPSGHMPSRIHLIQLAELTHALLDVLRRQPNYECAEDNRRRICRGPADGTTEVLPKGKPRTVIGPLDTPSPGIPTTQRHDQRDLQLTASPGPAREPAVRHPTAALVADQGTLHDAGPPAA